jgi:hypothetical protein
VETKKELSSRRSSYWLFSFLSIWLFSTSSVYGASNPLDGHFQLPLQDGRGEPLKDGRGQLFSFIIGKKSEDRSIEGFLDSEDKIYINLESCKGVDFIFSAKSLSLVQSKGLKRIPIILNTREDDEFIKFSTNKELIVYGQNNEYGVYVDSKTNLSVYRDGAPDDNYETVTVDRASVDGTIEIPKKKVQYHLVLKGSSEVQKLNLLNKDLTAADAVSSALSDSIQLSWDSNTKEHTFTFPKGTKVNLTLQEKRVSPNVIPFDTWEQQLDESMKGELDVDLSPFKVVVKLSGREAKKITAVKLVSDKKKGTPNQGRVERSNNTYIAQFVDVDWKNGPFKISASAQGVYFELIAFNQESHFGELDSPSNQSRPVLVFTQNVWSYTEILRIRVIASSLGNPDLVVSLEDSEALPSALKNRVQEQVGADGRERLTDDNGEVVFDEVYDWRNAKITIKTSDGGTTLLENALIEDSAKIQIENSTGNAIELSVTLD